MPLTIWSARRRIENTACTSASTPPATMRDEQAQRATSPSGRRRRSPKNAPMSIMPSRPMFTTPGALGDDAAERRRRSAASRSAASPRTAPTRRRPTRGCRRPSPTEATAPIGADDAGGDRAPAEALAAAADARARRASSPISAIASDGHGVRTSDRRQRDVPGDHAERDARPAHPARVHRARRTGRAPSVALTRAPPRACRRRRPEPRPAQPPRAGDQPDHQHVGADEEHDEALDDDRQVPGQLGGEDRRVEVALRRPAHQRAEQQRGRGASPIAVLRPSSATAMPRKPTPRNGVQVVRGDAELPAEHVHRARQPGEDAADAP